MRFRRLAIPIAGLFCAGACGGVAAAQQAGAPTAPAKVGDKGIRRPHANAKTTNPDKGNSGNLKPFFNGFEQNTAGWCSDPTAPCDGVSYGTIDRVPSGFSNYGRYAPFIQSEAGRYHARVAGAANTPSGDCVGSGSGATASPPCTGPYTLWGTNGSASKFPKDGFATVLDIYLDTSWASRHTDRWFDWDTALNDSAGAFLQDYVFNAKTEATGFVIGSSTNADRSGQNPDNPCPNPGPTSNPPTPCRAPVHVTSSGWYRFIHRFHDDGTGNLDVEMTIVNDSNGSTVADWHMNPGHPISTVGGPAYGFLPNEEIDGLPIDNSALIVKSGEGD